MRGDVVFYTCQVRGRTKYLHSHAQSESASFIILKRYSELRELHKFLEQELRDYIKEQKIVFPEFPPKSLLKIKKEDQINRRATQLQQYYDEIFDKLGEKVLYTSSFIDLACPKTVDIALVGDKSTGKTSYIRKLTDLLKAHRFSQKEAKPSEEDEERQNLLEPMQTNEGNFLLPP